MVEILSYHIIITFVSVIDFAAYQGLVSIFDIYCSSYFCRLFDRERMFRYHFEVFAIDSGLYGPRSQSVQVTVHILDKNDNPPVFTEYPYHIEISQPGNGDSVIQVHRDSVCNVGKMEWRGEAMLALIFLGYF